jgi:hypothetical protein
MQNALDPDYLLFPEGFEINFYKKIAVVFLVFLLL